jgi:hypothetical protein
MTPARDDMGIGVFLVAAGTEQVIQQRFDVLPARGADLPDHLVTVAATASFYPRALRTASATSSMWPTRRMVPAA